MADEHKTDEYKEKFRPEQTALEQEVDAALAGVSLDDLYGFDKPAAEGDGATAAAGGGAQPPARRPESRGVRRGRVERVTPDDVFVDLGGKDKGFIPRAQFEEEPQVGQEIDVTVTRYDEREGLLILSRLGAVNSQVNWENLEVGQIVEGSVTGMNKGGLELDVKGMRAFMPAGQVDIVFHKDISTFIGQRMQAEVTKFDARGKNLILSRRHILEREKEEKRVKLLEELEEGQSRRGVIRSVMDYGAFVDLDGIDGLLHVSEMSYRRGRHPSEFVKVGDIVDVKIIKFDREKQKLSLSLKQAMPDPWTGAETKYSVGTELTGRVARVEGFGAFVEVDEGLEGLLPVSEMSWQRIRHPADVVKAGDTIKLKVIAIDPEQKKLTFSLKQVGPDPWATVKERYATDTVVTGKVTRVVDFGAFVELEPGLEGLIHISELAGHRVRAAGDVVKPDQEVQVRILEIDPNARRVSLSIRRVQEPAKPAEAAPAAAATAAAAPAKKKKRPELRGGLDWGWQ